MYRQLRIQMKCVHAMQSWADLRRLCKVRQRRIQGNFVLARHRRIQIKFVSVLGSGGSRRNVYTRYVQVDLYGECVRLANSESIECIAYSQAGAEIMKQWVRMVRMGRFQSFMLILGRVRLGHFSCGSFWVRSRKLDPHPTLDDLQVLANQRRRCFLLVIGLCKGRQ